MSNILKEYYIDYHLYTYTDNGDIISFGVTEGNLWTGKDEYDAFSYFAKTIIKKWDMPEKRLNRFKWAYLRPTGRVKASNKSVCQPFISVSDDVRPYIKGQITRFAARFITCDNEDELNWHHNMYQKTFIQGYREEIPEYAIAQLNKWYDDRLILIRENKIKRINYKIDEINNIIGNLRMSGYRIENKANKYIIIEPLYYNHNWFLMDKDKILNLDNQGLVYYYKLKMKDFEPVYNI